MIPPIAEAVSVQSVPVKFDEADSDAMLMLDLIKERYVGMEQPIMVFSRDGFSTLVIPLTIKKVFPARNES